MQSLGPESLTWRYFGDLRTVLLGMWTVVMQNMYPELGRAVEEHSIMTQEPVTRVARSMYPIMGVVYDQDRAAATGRQVRDYHQTINRTSGDRPYHALAPNTFYWAHVTFFMQMVRTVELFFDGGLSWEEQLGLYEEQKRWYAAYGVTMRPVPASYDKFCVFYQQICSEVLEINKATADILWIRHPKPRYVPLPGEVWRWLTDPLVAGQRWITTGCLDPVVREKAGLAWTVTDEFMFRRYTAGVRVLFRFMPEWMRLHPRARQAFRRAKGQLPPDAPLVDAPQAFAPPRHRRGLPQHHVPGPHHASLLGVLAHDVVPGSLWVVAWGLQSAALVLERVRTHPKFRRLRFAWPKRFKIPL